jgi:hypothetical protein
LPGPGGHGDFDAGPIPRIKPHRRTCVRGDPGSARRARRRTALESTGGLLRDPPCGVRYQHPLTAAFFEKRRAFRLFREPRSVSRRPGYRAGL